MDTVKLQAYIKMRGIDFVSGADGARMDGADGRGVGLAGGVACLPANNI